MPPLPPLTVPSCRLLRELIPWPLRIQLDMCEGGAGRVTTTRCAPMGIYLEQQGGWGEGGKGRLHAALAFGSFCAETKCLHVLQGLMKR